MTPYCYLDGQTVPVADAKVGVYDTGLLRGFGIYEALATYNRKPFMFDAHMARFRASADRLGLDIPVSDEELRAILLDLMERNVPEGEAAVRIILTGGEAIGGIDYDRSKPTFYVLVEPMQLPPAEAFENGVSVIVAEHQRQLPECKTIDYIEAVMRQKERKEAGALEVLFISEGLVRECATSNVFVVKHGVIATPKDRILLGITRKAAIMAAEPRFPLEERDVTVDELYAADEAFITSSFKDVVPVVRVGDRVIGDGKPGPVTREVMRLFHELTQAA